jgi:hypothetical protein
VQWLETGEGERDVEGSSLATPKVAEALAQYTNLAGPAQDYRTVVHTLADVFEDAGIDLPVKRFLALADATYRKFGGKS